MFRTYEPTRDRLIAIKVFRLDITPEQAQALAVELSRAADAGLFHPSIVEPVAAGVEGTVAYRAEEYVAAESLDAAIRHYAPASLDKALPFITQLAGAIDFARAAGIGHGALHLRDVFVTPDEARASGFGVVEALERQGLRAPVRRPYSAPERIAGAAWGTAADVFSLAAIAFELLTGRRPSGTGDRIGPVTGDHLGAHTDMLQAVLARAMDDDPDRRHPSALGFASALEAAARGERVTGAMEQVGAISGMAAPVAAIHAGLGAYDDGLTEDDTFPSDADVGGATPFVDLTIDEDEDPDVFTDVGMLADADVLADAELRTRADVLADAHELADVDELADADEPADEDEGADEDELAHPDVLVDAEDGPPRVAEAAASLLVDPDAGADLDDIAPERDFDESLDLPPLDGQHEAVERAREPNMFDHDEAAEDLALAPPPTGPFAAAVSTLQTGRDDAFGVGYSDDRDDVRTWAVAEPPRRAMLPGALMLILGLLVGFAAGYAVRGRPGDPAPAANRDAGPAGEAQPGAAQGAGAGVKAPGSERTFSEQVVTPPPPAPAPPRPATSRAARTVTSGSLAVSSVPSAANVTVNGQWRGRTPLRLDSLAFGAYSVRVVQAGYVVAQQSVRLTAGEPSGTVNVRLERAPAAPASKPPAAAPRPAPAERRTFTGSMYIDSRPRGARVLLNGKPVGTTPVLVPEVSIGSQVVRLELADHRPWATSTRVSAGEEARVTGSLERIR